jgi:hypothetical protein
MLMRCLATTAITATDYSKQFAIGEVVDFSTRLPAGGTLGDVLQHDCFEAFEPPQAVGTSRPARKRSTADTTLITETPDAPVEE